ncbi:hypothetical protein Patl1_35009 [Pistacia atlantica]|uniref:Uncharacterized protein n=1 Tax=Pistacia atlantica TaxID=434234 RepID=A0ACC0ZTL8_9ROSI|nr:hypothetical protein Patl1_35009 [Pistacia atlantica]
MKLMHGKFINQRIITSFDMIFDILHDIIPDDSNLPYIFYAIKKLFKDLGLGYETIDACNFDCALFGKTM